MSWQAYIDDNLVKSGHIDKAAIFSKAGDSEWATSAGFKIIPEEIAEVVNCFNDKTDKVFADGLHIAGERFVLTKVDEEEKGDKVVLARKGREGIIAAQSKLAILVAHYPDGTIAGNTRVVVEQLRDYLKSVNY